MKDLKFIFYFIFNLKNSNDGLLFSKRYINKSKTQAFIKTITLPFAILRRKHHSIEYSELKEKQWFFVYTLNQYNTIKPIYESLNGKAVIVTNNHSLYLSSMKSIYYLDFYEAKFFLIKYPFFLISLLLISVKDTFKYIDYFALHFGIRECAIKYLKFYKPKSIIFSNDHNPYCRAFLLGALKMRIPSVYIQHASVSQLFPPLTFNYSLLDGKDSLNKYQKINPISGQVVLVGIPKFDQYVSLRRNIIQINTIGIGYNTFDDIEKINELVSNLSIHFPNKKIIIRSHPSDTRKIKSENLLNVSVSDSTKQNSFEFIGNIDMLVCGDSALHLEANMLNRPCLYYRSSQSNMFDYYGYLSNNIMVYVESIESIIEFVNSYRFISPGPFVHSKYYNEAILSDFEGHSTENIKNYLIEKLNLDA